jgi:histidine ammonia-lyase
MQALDLRTGYKLGTKSQFIYDLYRKHIPFLKNDEIMYPYINQSIKLIDEIILEINKRGWLTICK